LVGYDGFNHEGGLQMARVTPKRIRLTIPEWIVKRWCVVCYLTINWKISDLVRQIKVEPPKNFYKVAAEHLYDYVHKDVMPPKEIAPAILNIAEDYMAGKPVQFRPGDYIMIQDYVRKMK
jgi:hypothetical protein